MGPASIAATIERGPRIGTNERTVLSRTFPAAASHENDRYFLTGRSRTDAIRPVETDWDSIINLALEIISSQMMETPFERVCRLAEAERPPTRPVPPTPRPTPQTTIEALLYCVRVRGLAALKE